MHFWGPFFCCQSGRRATQVPLWWVRSTSVDEGAPCRLWCNIKLQIASSVVVAVVRRIVVRIFPSSSSAVLLLGQYHVCVCVCVCMCLCALRPVVLVLARPALAREKASTLAGPFSSASECERHTHRARRFVGTLCGECACECATNGQETKTVAPSVAAGEEEETSFSQDGFHCKRRAGCSPPFPWDGHWRKRGIFSYEDDSATAAAQ